jgi:hypothetical protein
MTGLGIGPGSIELPHGICLSCPRCGEAAADKGQCLIGFATRPEPSAKSGQILFLRVGCRICNYVGEPAFGMPIVPDDTGHKFHSRKRHHP